MRRTLGGEGAASETIEALLDDLTRAGFLSDERAAESLVRNRAARFGRARLARELRERGIAAEVAERVLAESAPDDLSAARAVWQRKFGAPPANEREKARQVRFLQARGFPVDVILKILREP